MKTIHLGLATALLFTASQNVMAFNITFDYSLDDGGFFASQERKDVLNAAGNYWGSRITSNFNAALSTPGGSSYDARFGNPSRIFVDAQGDLLAEFHTESNLSVQENEYKIFVGADHLPSPTVAFASFGKQNNLTINGDENYQENVMSRGHTGFSSWGGWMSFDDDADTNWYFDDDVSTDDVPDDQIDFYSFALHELGHTLGLGGSDEWNENILNTPGGDIFIGDNLLDTNGLPVEVDGSHFIAGTDSIMVAVIESGDRKLPTNIDFAALRDIGWEASASPVPVPTAVWLFGTGLLGLLGFKKSHST